MVPIPFTRGNSIMNLNKQQLAQAVQNVVALAKAKKAEGDKGRQTNEKALDAVRALARDVNESGLPAAIVGDLLRDSMKAAKLPKGTVNGYSMAFRGFAIATAQGVDVTAVPFAKADGTEATKPMPAPEAQRLAKIANETPDQKAEREANEAKAEVIAGIVKRLRAVDDLATLQAIAESPVIPAMPEADAEAKQPTESAADKAAREAREAAAAALEAAFNAVPATVREAA